MRAGGLRRAALVAVLSVAPVAGARGAAVDAPLRIGTEGPLRTLFLDMTGADARLPRSRELAVRWQMSNDWSTQTVLSRRGEVAFVQFDAQSDAFTISFSSPWPVLSHRLATTVEARVTLWSGGWTDAPVEAWHRALGFTNFERQFHPDNQLHLMVLDGTGATAFDVHTAKWSFGHAIVRNQLLLASGGESLRPGDEAARARWAVSARIDVRLPVGSPSSLGGSGGTDGGAGLFATAELARWWVLHANVFTSAWSDLGGGVALQPLRFHHGFELSSALVFGRWAVLVEDRVLSPILPGDWKPLYTKGYADVAASATYALTRWHNQISVGVRRGWFTTWFSEDFTPGRSAGTSQWFFNSNSPDISFGIELGHSL